MAGPGGRPTPHVMTVVRVKTKNPRIGVHAMTMQDGANVSVIVADDGAVAIDVPMQPIELGDWRAKVAEATDGKPLKWIVLSSPERVNPDTLKLLAPIDKPPPKVLAVPTVIQDAGFQQLYQALESAQPRATEPLSAYELRKRGILPELTFGQSITLTFGNAEPVELDLTHVGGCLPGASFVTIRNAGVVFVGDHIATEDPPVMYASSDLDKWIDALVAIEKDKRVVSVVPGRGRVGEHDIVAKTLEFLRAARSGLKRLARSGKGRDAVASLVPQLMSIYQARKNGNINPNAYMFSIAAQSLQLGLEQLYDQIIRKPIEQEP